MNTTYSNHLRNSLASISVMMFSALLLTALTLSQSATAQNSYKISGSQNVMTLYGTSTMHDWTMVAKTFSCSAYFDVSAANELTALQALNLTLPIHNLKSEHDGMNDNAYESLKADKFKDITFRATSTKITATGGHKYQLAVSGNLTIAGATKAVVLNAAAVVNNDGSVSCSGSVPLKLSEFGIERPSFMLGTMKVGDALTLNYAVLFVK